MCRVGIPKIEKMKRERLTGASGGDGDSRASRESRQDGRRHKKVNVGRGSTPRVAPWIALCDPQRGEGGGDDAARREPSTHRALTHLQKGLNIMQIRGASHVQKNASSGY